MLYMPIVIRMHWPVNNLSSFIHNNPASLTLKDYIFSRNLYGSTDTTLSVMKEICDTDSHYKYISFSRNFGKEAAMYAGFCNSDGDYAAIMDADMQDPPALLPDMLHCLETEDYDSVATRRVSRIGEPKIRSFFARNFYKLINKISDADVVDGARDFRLMKREMVDSIVAMCEYNRFSKGIFGWIGFKTKWLEYENVNRIAGETKWSFWGLFKYAVDGIINFSETPMSLASGLGIFLTIFSFLMVIFIIIRKEIFGDPVAAGRALCSGHFSYCWNLHLPLCMGHYR